MRFLLSEVQQALFETVLKYALERCEAGVRRSSFESETGFDPDFWQALVTLGVASVATPEEYGGMGLGLTELALTAEALGFAGAPGPFLGHVLAVYAISAAGSPAQRERWLPRLASGDAIATVAFSDGQGRVRPSQWTMAVSRHRVFGAKFDVPYAEFADLTVVGVQGGFALVEREAVGQAVRARNVADRTRRLAHVRYDATPAEAMPTDAETAERIADAALVLLAADAFGGASRLVQMSAEYAKSREQFGGPIGRFQGLKHQLANMAVDVEPARGLYWYAAHAHDIGASDATRVAALAKAHLGDVFMQASRGAVEAHGGIGFTWEHDVQIWFKRAMFDFAYLGRPSWHRERAALLAGW